MNEFSKVFTVLDGHQVLVFKHHDTKKKAHTLFCRTDIMNQEYVLEFKYDNRAKRDKDFDQFDQKKAENFRLSIEKEHHKKSSIILPNKDIIL